MNKDYTKLKDFAQKRLDDSCENGNDYDIRYWVGYIDGLNALQKRMDGDMAIEALEKQIPKKVIFQSGFKGLRYCPCCNVRFIGWGMKYCGECGQALDWSDDNA